MNGADLAAVITAGVGALTAIGVAVKFVWNKLETRFLFIENELQKCQDKHSEEKERRGVHLTVIELLWQELTRHDPKSTVLQRAKKLLDEIKG